MDPISIIGTLTGLITLSQSAISLLGRFYDDVRSYPKDFKQMVSEITSLYAVLCGLQSEIEKLRTSSKFQGQAERGPTPSENTKSLVDIVELSREQLEDCKGVLNEFADLLRKHQPGNSRSRLQCFNILLAASKKGKRGDILQKIERHKSRLAIAL